MIITVNGKTARITDREPITAGEKGRKINLVFSPEWDGLTKSAYIYNSNGQADPEPIPLFDNYMVIPESVTFKEGNRPVIVFKGTNANGEYVYPSVECELGTVWNGLRNGGEFPIDPTWADMIQAQVDKNTAEISEKIPKTEKAQPNGVATLDEQGKIPAEQLPSSSGVTKEYVDNQDLKTLEEAKNYSDSKLVTIEIEDRGSQNFWTRPVTTANEIIDMVNAGKEVRLSFYDTITETGDQIYPYENTRQSVCYFRRNVITEDAVSRISWGVQYNGSIVATEIPYNPPLMTAYATCNAEAEPSQAVPVQWFIPKTVPKPSGEVGMMLDVFWKNGRADGIGYDISLVWGEEGAEDNEIIVPTSPATNSLTGEYSIPAEGTIRYQLIEQSGRKRWRYVSGKLISRSFSTDTAADVADKSVPGMEIAYLPGMEIFIQMDKGNTADVMRLVPDSGETLPVYGNGTGTKTGAISKGTILHLKNAGSHWQILNGSADLSVVAPAIPVTMTGAAVATDMVSAFKHPVECRVEKINFCHPTIDRNIPGLSWTTDGDSVTFNGKCGDGGAHAGEKYFAEFDIPKDLKPEDIWTVAFYLVSGTFTLDSFTGNTFSWGVYDNISGDFFLRTDLVAEDTKNGFVTRRWSGSIPAGANKMRIAFTNYSGCNITFDNAKFRVVVRKGKQKEWAPYIPDITTVKVVQTGTDVTTPHTFPVSENGIVEGMESTSPEMAVTTDKPGATITATYNADTKRYIDHKFTELQALAVSLKGGM